MDTTLHLGSLISFRMAIHASFTLRTDALFELIDALLLSRATQSPVELSQSPAFRRKFAGVYDALRHGKLNREVIRRTWHNNKPPEAITVGGYAVYVQDSTITPRPAAETLRDRGQVYSAESL